MGNDNLKVSKLEDIIDTCSIVAKSLAALASISVGAATLTACLRLLNLKNKNPELYWNNKNSSLLSGNQAIAKSIDNVADALNKK